MSISYSEMMKREDKAQRLELEKERLLLIIKKAISKRGYDIADDALSTLTDAVDLIVNDYTTVGRFKYMSISQLDRAYQNAIRS